MKKTAGNKAAAALVKERWKKTTPEERSEVARALNDAQWNGPNADAKRKAQGARLAAARKAAREKRDKAKVGK